MEVLTEETVIDKKEILQNGIIQVRTATVVYRDGVEISRSFTNRQAFAPGADVSEEPTEVQELAAVIHTADCIAKYEAQIKANDDRRKALESGLGQPL